MRKHLWTIIYGLTFLGILSGVYALNLSRVKTWSSGEVLTHTDLNAEFDNIINHSIVNADISGSAAIQASKLDQSVAGAIGATTPAAGTFTTLSSTGATTIGDAAADSLQVNANTIQFEGATANDYETIFSMPDPTASDNTITFPDIDGTVVTSAGAGGDIDIGTYELRANTLESDVATGTAPFTIASTTVSTNLNADLLDGQTGSYYSTATNLTGIVPIANGGTGVALTQRGRATLANDGTVTYPTTFGDTNYTLILTGESDGGNIFHAKSKSATGFTFYTNGGGSYVVNWLAIDDV